MKIKATCGHCGRELLVQQLEDSGGHCPWCGKAFTRDYTANLAQRMREAEAAGTMLEDALEDLSGMDLALTIDEESIVEPVRRAVRAAGRARTRVRR